jgi:hypothetical protein
MAVFVGKETPEAQILDALVVLMWELLLEAMGALPLATLADTVIWLEASLIQSAADLSGVPELPVCAIDKLGALLILMEIGIRVHVHGVRFIVYSVLRISACLRQTSGKCAGWG